MNVLICDPISPKGIEYFRQQPGFRVTVLEKRLSEIELLPLVGEAEALVVRSETKITRKLMEAAPELLVVGRDGVGVDNVDVEAATQRGVIVMNTPSGNTISTAELTFSMLMALARKIPQAHSSMKAGEWNRKAFQGTELYNKTLGILGMGRIGSEVAKRAQAFVMTVLAYDPYLNLARAKALQVELVELDDLYGRADFITVHMPMSDETNGMINAAAFAKMKKGVRVLNCARGGIINEKELYDAITSGKVSGAALDVYEVEPMPKDFPLRTLPEVIMTPHFCARPDEAQENMRALDSGLDIVVEEIKTNEDTDYNEWIHVAVKSGEQRFSAGGTVFGKRHLPRIVRLNSRPVEIVPEGVLFLMNNKDRPGIVGYLGTLMSKHNVNIASMSLSSDNVGG